jgi:hypothetical protein
VKNDFHLTGATNPGMTQSAKYSTDPDGVKRGDDGVWDRGAYEFGRPRPEPPTNLNAIVR